MNLCNFCKKEIIDIDNSSKFCSHNCKLEHFKKRYPPKKEKKCNFCNNTLDFNFFRIVKIVKKGPKKGYTPGNLVIVCDIVNRVKSDATLEQMEMIFRFYSKLLKSNK